MPLGNVRFSALQIVFSTLSLDIRQFTARFPDCVPYMWVTLETVSNRIPNKQQWGCFTFCQYVLLHFMQLKPSIFVESTVRRCCFRSEVINLSYTFPSKLRWGSYIISIAKTASKKNAAFDSFCEVSPEAALLCMEYCCHVWADGPSCYLEMLDELQKRTCRIADLSFVASPEPSWVTTEV